MKVQANPETSGLANEAPLAATPMQSSLSSFDKKYTLTGLIKHIQMTLGELIQAKQAQAPQVVVSQTSEIHKLVKVKEEVGLLKTIVIHNINQIFSNIYPSGKNDKKSDKTNHTLSSHTLNNEHLYHKEMNITDFQVQELNQQLDPINNFEVNKENIVHYNNLYPERDIQNEEPLLLCNDDEDDQSERMKVEKQRMLSEITPFSLAQFQNISNIKIEQDDADDDLDLVCYEDGKLINERKQKKQAQQSKNQKGFSPILQRPLEEEQTMQKQVKNEANITFNNRQKNIFSLTSNNQAQLKRRLFSYTNRPALPQRHQRKKYVYLEKAKLK